MKPAATRGLTQVDDSLTALVLDAVELNGCSTRYCCTGERRSARVCKARQTRGKKRVIERRKTVVASTTQSAHPARPATNERDAHPVDHPAIRRCAGVYTVCNKAYLFCIAQPPFQRHTCVRTYQCSPGPRTSEGSIAACKTLQDKQSPDLHIDVPTHPPCLSFSRDLSLLASYSTDNHSRSEPSMRSRQDRA